jgi:hypothetical protein
LYSEMIWKIQKKTVKRYEKYGRKVGWIVKWYGIYGMKVGWTYFRYLFTIQLTFLPYFPILSTIQPTFLPYFLNHFTIQLTLYGKYRRKLWKDLENTEENCEKIGKIWKKVGWIVKRYEKYGRK